MNQGKITFLNANKDHLDLVRKWWSQAHIRQWWDNSPQMWLNFENYALKSKKDLYDYWIAFYDNEPYALLLTSDANNDTPDYMLPHICKGESTYTIDIMIGNQKYLGKGLAAQTLIKFKEFLSNTVKTFIIDPQCENKKACHVYEKAGFKIVDTFIPDKGYFKNKKHYLMVWRKSMRKKIEIIPYDPKWPQMFAEEAKKIKATLKDNCLEIYHVGSTSVPGLCAKAQIDIMCVVKNLKAVTDKLETVGYTGRGELNLPLKLFFSKKIPNDVNLHVLTKTNGEIEWNLVFQNYLRNNPNARDEYANTKLKLIKENPDGFKMIEGLFTDYTTQKTDVIMKIAKEAGFNGYRFVNAISENEIGSYKTLMQVEKIDQSPNVFHLCLYKGIEIVAAACVDFSEDNLLKIKKISAINSDAKNKMLGKLKEWAKFHERKVI